jgi:phospholipid transport system substrate-binding protein
MTQGLAMLDSNKKTDGLSRRSFLALIGSTVTPQIFFNTGLAHAAPTPEVFITGVTSEVMRLAGSQLPPKVLRGKFASLLGKHVNMRGIANFALGPFQKQLPSAQRDEFYELVTEYAAALFAWYAKDFQGESVEIVSTSTQGKFTTVQSSIKGKGLGGEQVNWRLVESEGSYRVSDVKVKNVWLGIAMKQRFGDVLKKSKGDFGPLFSELREADTWWK